MKSGIYQITNEINGKLYIGSGVYCKGRWASHRYYLRKGNHFNHYLQRSWNKYGEDNFKFEILELVESRTELIKKEQEWIIKLNSTAPNGYNIKIATNSGFVHSAESLIKMSNYQKAKTMSEEAKAKISKAHTGMKKPRTIPFSEEHKLKLRLARVGMKFSESHKRKLSKPDKWPCADGWKCKCENCRFKRNQMAKSNHVKRLAKQMEAAA